MNLNNIRNDLDANYYKEHSSFQFGLAQSLLEGHSFNQWNTILDVGCGEGFALAYFARKSFKVNGLDFSSAGVCSQNPDFADCVETGDLFSLLEKKSLSGRTIWSMIRT